MQASDGRTIMRLLGGSQFGLHAAQVVIAVEQAIAGIRRQLATQQGEQAGFTGAIGTDQAGLVTGVQGQLGAFEKTLRATL